jgi:hypothetical protein
MQMPRIPSRYLYSYDFDSIASDITNFTTSPTHNFFELNFKMYQSLLPGVLPMSMWCDLLVHLRRSTDSISSYNNTQATTNDTTSYN